MKSSIDKIIVTLLSFVFTFLLAIIARLDIKSVTILLAIPILISEAITSLYNRLVNKTKPTNLIFWLEFVACFVTCFIGLVYIHDTDYLYLILIALLLITLILLNIYEHKKYKS